MEVVTAPVDGFISICYESIIDHYSYGQYGPFKIIIDKKNLCFNATKLCEAAGRQFKDWLRNQQSKQIIEYYQTENPDQKLKYTISGGNGIYNTVISGTYLRKELFLSLASWISIDFFAKATKIVEDYYVKHYLEECKKELEEANQKVNELENEKQRASEEIQKAIEEKQTANHRVNELENEKQRANEEIQRVSQEKQRANEEKEILNIENRNLTNLNTAFQRVEEDISLKPMDPNKQHVYELFIKHEDTPFTLHALRRQKGSYKAAVKKLRKKHPYMESILKLEYDPNPINLFNRLREQNKIRTHFNDIQLLNDYSISQIIIDVEDIARNKIRR